MTIMAIQKLPDISDYLQYITSTQISSDTSIVTILKQLYRADDVIVDIYLNEIADDTKIVSGKRLTPDSQICLPRYDIEFEYRIDCMDIDGIDTDINKYNTHKFYLQFTKDDGKEWEIE